MKTIAVVNQKGGCGKTTTAVNLAAALAEQHQNVLLMDLDPQAHATIGFGQDPDALKLTVYEAMTRPHVKLTDILLPTKMERLTLAPSSVILASVEVELARAAGREQILGHLLSSVRDRFELCVIDCAPSFGILTIGALIASTDVIVPVQAHYYSMEGLRRVLETIRLIRERFHRLSPGQLNILLTLVEDRTTLSKQIQEQMREIFGSLVFRTVIHNNVRLCEAPSAGEPVLEYAPRSRGALEYRALAAEILGNVPVVEAVGSDSGRRGIQRDLAELFGRLQTRTRPPAPSRSQVQTDPSRAGDGEVASARSDKEGNGTETPCDPDSESATEIPCDLDSESEPVAASTGRSTAFAGLGTPPESETLP